MDIKYVMVETNRIATNRGFRDNASLTIAEEIALMHSELSEALECYREKQDLQKIHYNENERNSAGYLKPEGIAVEFADALMRICETAEHYGIPLERAIHEKMNYNRTRPYKHGKKI